MTKAALYRWLADAVLVVHFSFVLFVVGGLVLIGVGAWRRWAWVRGLGFRAVHLLAMAVVLAETLGGMRCPLTDWEDQLRVMGGSGGQPAGSFMQRWIHRVMFYEVSSGGLAIVYVVFFALVVATFCLVRPRWPWGQRSEGDRR